MDYPKLLFSACYKMAEASEKFDGGCDRVVVTFCIESLRDLID